MKRLSPITILFSILMLLMPFHAQSQQLDAKTVEKLKASGFETRPEVFKEFATGGQPMGR